MLELNRFQVATVVDDAQQRVPPHMRNSNDTNLSALQVPFGTCENLALIENNSSDLVVLPPVMRQTEARQCLSDIKQHWLHIRALVFALKQRRGWEVLQYPNLTACLSAEFPESRTKLVRELRAAEVEKYVLQVPIGTYPASCFRPLARLKPEQYKLALDKALSLAGNHKLTASHLTVAVRQIISPPRSLKQIEPLNYQPGELVRIQCQPKALRTQKIWDGCWGVVQSTDSSIRIKVGNKEVDYQAANGEFESSKF